MNVEETCKWQYMPDQIWQLDGAAPGKVITNDGKYRREWVCNEEYYMTIFTETLEQGGPTGSNGVLIDIDYDVGITY